MINIFNLIRWKNLVLIVLAQTLVKYVLLESFNIQPTLSTLQFSLLVMATVCIAAAGNIINDIYDIETDLVNKPNKVIVGKSISEERAFNLYVLLNITGVGLGFYLANNVGKNSLATLFVIISALLYMYSHYLKRLFLIGNIIISLLISSSILIIGLFDLLPSLSQANRELYLGIIQILFLYSFFAFILNLIREIVKDIEDIDGDYNTGMKTMPVVIGRERTKMVAFALSLIPILALIYLVVDKLYMHRFLMAYIIFFIIGPLIYISMKLFSANTKKNYQHISNILKLVMLFGVLSLVYII